MEEEEEEEEVVEEGGVIGGDRDRYDITTASSHFTVSLGSFVLVGARFGLLRSAIRRPMSLQPVDDADVELNLERTTLIVRETLRLIPSPISINKDSLSLPSTRPSINSPRSGKELTVLVNARNNTTLGGPLISKNQK